MKAIKKTKTIRKIALVSSAAFSAASCVYGWAAPLGAMLGLAVNLTEDRKNDNIKDFSNAVESALERTKTSIYSEAKQRILEELSEIKVTPSILKELIEETESYRKYYCTKKDAQEIINVFEMYLREEIAKSPNLSNLYILSTGVVTLEKLKTIVDCFDENNKKLEDIKSEVSSIRKMLENAKIICFKCIISITFVLVSTAFFLSYSFLSDYHYDKTIFLIAPICYGISDFLMFFLRKEMHIKVLNRTIKISYFVNKHGRVWNAIVSPFFSIILTISCFYVMIFLLDINIGNSFFLTSGLIFGKLISIFLKMILYEI